MYCSAVTSVMRMHHTVDGTHLEIVPYLEDLGPVPPNSGDKPCWIPADIHVTAEPQIVSFILSHPAVQSTVEDELSRTGPCAVNWSDISSDCGSITIHFTEVISPSRVKLCQKKLTNLLCAFTSKTVSILQEMWNMFRTSTEETVGKKYSSSDMSIDFSDADCTVRVTGHTDHCESVIEELLSVKDSVEAEFQRRKTVITESLKFTNLQVPLLRACGLLNDDGKVELLKIDIEADKVTLTGMSENVMAKKLKLYELLAKSIASQVTLDDFVLQLLNKKPFRDYVMQEFAAKSLTSVVWRYTGGTSVAVYGTNQTQVS